LRDKIKELTFFNADTSEVGLLFGKTEVLRIQSSMGRVLTGRYQAGTSSMSPAAIGLALDQEGALSLDGTKLKEAIASNREAVEAFLTTKDTGFVARVDKAIESIAGANNGLLITRTTTLNNQIDRNATRIESMNRRLEVERVRLLKQFFGMEEAIAKLQTSQKYVSSIQTISFASNR
jgi:flagellar hook-associated protein 2